jgi:hypothetical protein
LLKEMPAMHGIRVLLLLFLCKPVTGLQPQ